MGAEFSANAAQTVSANGSLIFSETPVPCNRGLVYHRDESGIFRLASPSVIGCSGMSGCRRQMPTANYRVGFHANISVPTGGTAEAISLALSVDGEIDPSSIMTVTPAAVEEAFNVGAGIIVVVPWICRCASVSVRNVSTQPITVENANLTVEYLGIQR